MTQYAQYNPAVAAPSPVTGWYDTGFATYPNLPSSTELLEVSADQWAAHMANPGGWAVSAGALVSYAPAAVPPTLAQQAQAALGAGVAITSTGTPALNATYPTSGAIWEDLKDEAVFIASFAEFSSASGTMAFLLPSGPTITFTTTAQLQAVVKAISVYISALKAIIATNPGSGTLPAATATIA